MADKDRLRQLVIGDGAVAAYSKIYPDAAERMLQALDGDDPIMLALSESVLDAQDLRQAAVTRVLADEFGLTAAEAAVSAMLCTGANLRDIAAARGAAIATVRNQVKSVMAKAGVRRQPELVARLLAYL